MSKHLLGTGVLTWEASERRSDRYGYVFLLNPGGNSLNNTGDAPLLIEPSLIGRRCRLIARILETRQSTHIGDLFNGIFPRTPKLGSVIQLGIGVLDVICPGGYRRVGLMPVEDRQSNQWLDIRSLYDCHEQTVELIAEDIPEPATNSEVGEE